MTQIEYNREKETNFITFLTVNKIVETCDIECPHAVVVFTEAMKNPS